MLPLDLYRSADVRMLDRRAMEQGISGYTLMRRAGQAALDHLRQCWPEARHITVLCGTGNNGGDGSVIARLALQAGLQVRLLQAGDPARLRGDAEQARQDALAAGIVVEPLSSSTELGDTDLIVDALLGTGLTGDVTGAMREAIECINRAAGRGVPVLAIDVPSGLCSDTGRQLGVAVHACRTISFIGLKFGCFTDDGCHCAGHVAFSDLEVPAITYERGPAPVARRIDHSLLRQLLPLRARNSHKGHYGHTLVLGGDEGMGGAVMLAAEAAARAGSGWVSAATRAAHVAALLVRRPEVMARAVSTEEDVQTLMERASVLVLGPGLGRREWGRMLYGAVVRSDLPQMLDADALNLLAEAPIRRSERVLTPHPGEAARLLGVDTSDIQRDRLQAVQALQRRYDGVVVLKGAGTLICDGQQVWLCDAGNPGMASAGMGDVLAGLIGGLLAQGLTPSAAAVAGVWIHARAADMVARDRGERGLLASDLALPIAQLSNPLRRTHGDGAPCR